MATDPCLLINPLSFLTCSCYHDQEGDLVIFLGQGHHYGSLAMITKTSTPPPSSSSASSASQAAASKLFSIKVFDVGQGGEAAGKISRRIARESAPRWESMMHKNQIATQMTPWTWMMPPRYAIPISLSLSILFSVYSLSHSLGHLSRRCLHTIPSSFSPHTYSHFFTLPLLLIRYMMTGEAARKLGVSPRTLGRITTNLWVNVSATRPPLLSSSPPPSLSLSLSSSSLSSHCPPFSHCPCPNPTPFLFLSLLMAMT